MKDTVPPVHPRCQNSTRPCAPGTNMQRVREHSTDDGTPLVYSFWLKPYGALFYFTGIRGPLYRRPRKNHRIYRRASARRHDPGYFHVYFVSRAEKRHTRPGHWYPLRLRSDDASNSPYFEPRWAVVVSVDVSRLIAASTRDGLSRGVGGRMVLVVSPCFMLRLSLPVGR